MPISSMDPELRAAVEEFTRQKDGAVYQPPQDLAES